MMHHQYGISALFSQMSFGRETSGSVAKCGLFSQAIEKSKYYPDIGFDFNSYQYTNLSKDFLHRHSKSKTTIFMDSAKAK